jgi:predicted alpha/beta-fold hydrolase
VERTELMSDLDRLLCGPLYGYDDVEKYWEEASCIRRLG